MRRSKRKEGNFRTKNGKQVWVEKKVTEKKSDYAELADEIINQTGQKAFERQAVKEWKALPLAKRKAIRRIYKKNDKAFSPTVWFTKKSRGATTVSPTSRRVKKVPPPPSNPYAALLAPAVIVPDNMADPVIVADAGSIIRLMDQSKLYREWMSPITQRGDELLVQYGNAKKLKLGWITNKLDPKSMKPIKGPTFLVMTKLSVATEQKLSAWDRLRWIVGVARKKDGAISLASWLATFGGTKEQQPLLREVTREFGGKTVKNEPYVDRFNRLCLLILHTELDMALHKKAKKSKTRKVAQEKDTKITKKSKRTKPEKATVSKKAKKSTGDFSPRSKEFDDHIIRRLIKENPRRAGTTKFKLWAKIKKGMTVKEFITKYAKMHATRAEVGRYIQWGWIKLLPPSAAE